MKSLGLLVVGSLLCATAAAEDAKPIVLAKDVREGTKLKIVGDDKQLSIEVRCERGIDTCVLERTGEHWPANVEFKVHLRGLESFKVTSGNATLEWSVPSSGDHPARVHLHSGKRDAEIAPDDALFTPAKRVHLKADRYFSVPIPKKLLAENPQQLKVQWIDFYR